jgi:hypothetical protein
LYTETCRLTLGPEYRDDRLEKELRPTLEGRELTRLLDRDDGLLVEDRLIVGLRWAALERLDTVERLDAEVLLGTLGARLTE